MRGRRAEAGRRPVGVRRRRPARQVRAGPVVEAVPAVRGRRAEAGRRPVGVRRRRPARQVRAGPAVRGRRAEAGRRPVGVRRRRPARQVRAGPAVRGRRAEAGRRPVGVRRRRPARQVRAGPVRGRRRVGRWGSVEGGRLGWWRRGRRCFRCRCGRVGDDIARRRGPESVAAHRPGAAALGGQHSLGDGDLLFAGGLVRRTGELAATVGGPGALRELQPAVVAVSGVDGPVAAGLASSDSVPLLVGSRGRVARQCDATATDHSTGECKFGDADVRSGGLTMPSAHTPKTSSLDAPTRSAVGFGRKRSPGLAESHRNGDGFTPRSRGRLRSDLGGPVGPPSPSTGCVVPPIGWSSAL